MDFQYVNMVSDKKAEIRIYQTIGRDNATSDLIASEINFLIEYYEVAEILVKINSGGGSMVEGFGIFSAIQSAISKGVKVITQNDGLAASMGGCILVAGEERKMVDFGLLMLHDPSIPSKVDDKAAIMLKKFKESAIKMYAGKTSLSKKKLDKMMSEETWLNAEEALEMGFVTEIIKTGQKVDNQVTSSKDVEKILDVYNSIINNDFNEKPKRDMKKVALALGLDETATEAQVVEMIATNKRTLQKSSKHIDALLALGRTNGHVNDENEEDFRTLASKEYDTVFNVVSKPVVKSTPETPSTETPPVTPVNLTDVLEVGKGGEDKDPNNKANWDFETWSKKDPTGLLKMKDTKPEEYKALVLSSINQ